MLKRRSQDDGNFKHRPDGRREARLTLPTVRRKSVYGKTQKGARAKRYDVKKKMDAGIDLAADRILLAHYLTD